MEAVKTHRLIDRTLSGQPVELGEGFARVKLKTSECMVADEKGLVHGGFIFSAADYTAMLAVNHPNVVLAKAEVRFLKPVRVGEELHFEGRVVKTEGSKHQVKVLATRGGEEVFAGEFLCVVTGVHVLDR